jgi:hypothetical protein
MWQKLQPELLSQVLFRRDNLAIHYHASHASCQKDHYEFTILTPSCQGSLSNFSMVLSDPEV